MEKESIRIGRQIRDLRKAKGVTLITLAKKIGRSVGYVSQVERGVSSLPIPTLQAICEVFGVQISWFFHADTQAPADEINHIVRANARRSLNFTDTGIREELLTPRLSGQLKMVLTTFSPGAGNNEPRQRKGEETGVVQSGKIELGIGDKSFVLSTGDSFSLTEEDFHWVRNPSATEDAVVVWTLNGGIY